MPTLREQIDVIKADLESKPELLTQLDKEMYVMEKYKGRCLFNSNNNNFIWCI